MKSHKKTTLSFKVFPKDKKAVKKAVRKLLNKKGYRLYKADSK